MRFAKIVCLAVLAATPARLQAAEELAVRAELERLRLQLVALELNLSHNAALLKAVQDQAEEAGREVGAVKQQLEGLARQALAAAFLSGPPKPSDTAGVAHQAVFAPRLEADASRARDTIFVKLRRVEPRALPLLAELDLSAGADGLELPVDVSGALYVVEWSTSEGFSYNLTLRDGASGQAVAHVQVKPLQNSGRFLFVGYRLGQP